VGKIFKKNIPYRSRIEMSHTATPAASCAAIIAAASPFPAEEIREIPVASPVAHQIQSGQA